LEKLLKTARVKPVINQVELHPHLPQVDLVKFCEKNDILITAFSPVGGPGAPILDLPIIKEMAEKYDTTPNAILNSFHILQGRIVVPKSVHKDRIEAATVLVDITKEDLDKLTDFGVKNPKRYVAEDVGKKIGFDNWD
jgi:D-arabinose 1-dehydrogenase